MIHFDFLIESRTQSGFVSQSRLAAAFEHIFNLCLLLIHPKSTSAIASSAPVTPISEADDVLSRVLAMAEPT